MGLLKRLTPRTVLTFAESVLFGLLAASTLEVVTRRSARLVERQRDRDIPQLVADLVEANNAAALSGKDNLAVPETDEARRRAVGELMHAVSELLAGDPAEDLYANHLVIIDAWLMAFVEHAEHDRLSVIELALMRANALHLVNDYFSDETVIDDAWREIQDIVRSFSEASTEDNSPKLTRALRAAEFAASTLAHYYDRIHMPEEARRLLRRGQEFGARLEAHPAAIAQRLVQMAEVEKDLGDLQSARDKLEEAVRLYRSADPDNRLVAHSKAHLELALLLERMGEEAEAEDQVALALESARQLAVFGRGACAAEVVLAIMQLMRGSPRAAEVHARHLVNVVRDEQGDYSIMVSDPLRIVGMALAATSRQDEAAEFFSAASVSDIHRELKASRGEEASRMRDLANDRSELFHVLSLAVSHPDDKELARVAFTMVSAHRDLANEVTDRARRALSRDDSPYVRRVAARLADVRHQLDRALLGSAEGDVDELFARMLTIENSLMLAVRHHQFVAAEQGEETHELEQVAKSLVSAKRLHESIPAGAALIEYVRYVHVPQWPWLLPNLEHSYVALVWRWDADNPSVVPLGTAAALEATTRTLRNAATKLGDAVEDGAVSDDLVDEHRAAAIRVRETVFDAVAAQASDCQRLFIIPDGEIAMISLAALPVPGGHIADDYWISYLSSGKQLLRDRVDAPVSMPVVFADPDYDLGHPPPADAEVYERLRGAREEGRSVARLLGVEPTMDDEATHRRITELHSPAILHVTTHGWLLPEPDGWTPQTQHDVEQLEWMRHPRFAGKMEHLHHLRGWSVRSGLVTAGFNAAWAGHPLPDPGDIGLLTAGEAAELDLAATELVVLSACETGIGAVFDMQGVYGLRRAFQSAGARSVLTAMWRVPDAPTQLFMDEFYRELIAGNGRWEALRLGQLAVRRRYPDPYNWGAFVLHGDGGPLPPAVLEMIRHTSPAARHRTDARGFPSVRIAAEKYRHRGLEAAEAALRAEAEKDNAVAALALAQLCRDQGDEQQSASWLARSAEGGEPVAVYARALNAIRENDTDSAVALLWKALRDGLSEIAVFLADILLQQERRDEAESALTMGTSQHNAAAMYWLGRLLRDRNADEAIPTLVAAADRGSVQAAEFLAELARRNDDEDGHDLWWKRAAALGHRLAATDLADAAYHAGDFTTAIMHLRRVRGDMAAAHNVAALLGNHTAGRYVWWGLAARLGDPVAADELGDAATRRGDTMAAIRWWVHAATTDPSSPAALALGRELIHRGMLDEAERWLRPAALVVNDSPTDANVSAAMWLYEICLRRDDRAGSDFWFQLGLDAGHPLALAVRAHSIDPQNSTEAVQLWAAASNAGSPQAMLKVAEWLDDEGDESEAEHLWECVAIGQWTRDPLMKDMSSDAQLAGGWQLAAKRLQRGDSEGAIAAFASIADVSEEARRMLAVLGTAALLAAVHPVQTTSRSHCSKRGYSPPSSPLIARTSSSNRARRTASVMRAYVAASRQTVTCD